MLAWAGQGRMDAVLPGSPAPSFVATTLDGEKANLEDYRGRVVLLNIWATWCPPCREEMPSMERLYRTFKDRGASFEIVAVSIDAAPGAKDAAGNIGGDLRSFVDEFGLTFTILHDPSGRIQRTYRTTGVPESFIITADGTIFRRLVGAVEWDAPEWKATIQRLLPTGEDGSGSSPSDATP